MNCISPVKLVEIVEGINLPINYKKVSANIDSNESIFTNTDITKFIIISDKIELEVIDKLKYSDVEIIDFRARCIIVTAYYYDNFLIMVEWLL